MKKKVLILLLITALVFAGGMAAMSILPHTHGKDLDHSKHSTCPVHQISQICFAATAVFFVLFSVYLFSRRFIYFQPSFFEFYSPSRIPPRGPPAF